jgi:signal transduction histidine kinase
MNQLMDEVSSTVESNTMSDLVTPGQIQLGLTQKFDNSEASFFLYKRETTTTDKTEVSFISIVATYGTTSCKLLSNPISMMEVWDKAAKYQSSKEKFYIFESNNIDSRFNLMITDSGKKSSDTSITCCQFVKIEGTLYLLILDGRLTPVQPAVDTMKTQLYLISILVVVLTILVAMILSRNLSKPIAKMNDSAKRLAKGDYSVTFEGKGYSEINELNDTLNYAVTELKKTETLQHELIANISHDLKTPLTMITGYAEMMKDIPTEINTENLQIIIDEVTRLNTLVNDLLCLSKLSAKTEQLNLEYYNITECIKGIVSRQNKLYEARGFVIEFTETKPAYVYADVNKMNQVLYNFIINAINYSGDSRKIEIHEIIDNDVVRIEVQDFGIGIKEDELAIIWDRYYRVDKGHKRSTQGSGLGLAIVKGILEYHNFKYGVKSSVGVGSTFYFEMPIAKEEDMKKKKEK